MKKALLFLFVAIRLLYCKAGNIRLAGGSDHNEGRVEIFYNGTWGTVCDDRWDLNDAAVVCRSLGLSSASSSLCCAHFGQGSGHIFLDNVHCQGNEQSLLDCPHNGLRIHDCHHGEDASVVCGMPKVTQKLMNASSGVIESPGYPRYMKQAHYKWTFRPTIPNVRVAVYLEKIDLRRYYGGMSKITIGDSRNTSVFSVQNQRRHVVGVLLTNVPVVISFYSSYTSRMGYGGNGIRMRYFVFSGSDDATMCCEKINLTVQDTEYGRINISWTPLTMDPGTNDSAQPTYLVFYNSTAERVNNFTLVTNLTTAVIDYLSSNAWYSIEVGAFFSESNTFERGCPLRVKTEKLLKVRLAGGEAPNEGRVEVYYNGVWGAVCYEYWDMNDANVVCRSLGLPAASYVFSNTYMFGGERRRSWMTRLQCSGTESSLADCRHAGWGNTYSWWCSYHYYHAAVVCGQAAVTHKLMNASSGVMESPGYPRYMKQAHYKWTFRPTIPNARVAVYLEKIDLRRYYGGMSKITIGDSRNTSVFSVQNQRRHAVGVLLTNVPVVISFYSSHTSRMGYGGNGIRMRYFVFSGSDDATTCSEKFKLMLQDTEYGRINISWTPLTMDPGTNDSAQPTYLVFYNSTAERVNNFTLVTNLTTAVMDYLSSNAWYSIEVVAFFSESNTFERGCPLRVKTEKLLKVRLAGGEAPNEGRVEVYYNGVWGAVCDEYWDMNDANVVCRSLGLPAASYAFSNTYMFGGEHKRSWMTRLQCSGTESSLADCRHAGWGNTYYWCSYHYYHAAVVCGQPPVTQKLMNASSGVIESPGYPRYMKQAHYKWTFRPTIPNVRVAVYLEKIDLRRYYGGMSKITIGDSRNTSVFSVQNQRRHAVGVLLTNVPVVISFYSSHTSRMGYGGNGIRMRYFVFSGSDDATTCSEKFKLMLQDTEYGRINISWTPLTMDPGTNDSAQPTYLVFYNSTAERVNNFTLVTNLTTAVMDYLSSNAWYSIEVVAFFSESNTFERGCPLRVKTEKLLKVRLAGGEAPNEGRVEVYYNGVWGAVCDEYWDMNDANVVCRSLGLPAASYAFSNTYMFGGEHKRSWMTRLQCSGTESSLADCRHAGWGNTYYWCSYHYYHAAVVCGQPPVTQKLMNASSGVIESPGYPRYMKQAHYKWTFRPTIPNVRVAVYLEKIDLRRYYGGMSKITIGDSRNTSVFSVQNQRRHVVGVLLTNVPVVISFYSSYTSRMGYGGNGIRMRYFVFSGSDDATTCSEKFKLMLQDTEYGRINISWTPLTMDPGTNDSAQPTYLVFYNSTAERVNNFTLVTNLTTAVMDYLSSNAWYSIEVVAFFSESNTFERGCPLRVKTEKLLKVRLAGGEAPNEGRVEVYYNGVWGAVCDEYWDMNDANVVCRSLGLPAASYAFSNTYMFGGEHKRSWMTRLQCSGTESSLADCRHAGWGNTYYWCSYHYYHAAVVCGQPPVTQKLMNASSGVIESPGYPRYMKQAHYKWTFRPTIPNVRVAVYLEKIDLRRYYGGMSKITIADSRNSGAFSAENQRRHAVGVLLTNTPVVISFYSSHTSRMGHGGNGIRMRYFVFSGTDDTTTCSEKFKLMLQDTEYGRINISWTPLTMDPGTNDSAHPTYLVFYNSTAERVNNFTLVTNLTSAVIDYLSLNTWYSIEVVAFFSESNTFERGCPLRVKTEKLLKVRLAGGEAPNEGRVEVYYNGVWGAVCDEYWDMNDANVVCRSLGLPAASYAFSNTYMFGGEHKRSWMTRLQCSGTESSLADCRHAGWGNTYYWCSYHYYHAAVVCGQPPVTQKLMNASSGVIESPGYPRYMKQAHYKWTFRPTIPNVRVAVYLEKIDLRRYYGGMSKITIADSRNSGAFSAENQRRHAVGVLLTNTPVVISFYSSHTSRMGHGGNGIRMRYFVFSGTDDTTTCSEKFKLMLQDTEYGRINISWTPLTMDPGTNDSAHPTYLVFYNSTAERVNNFTLVTNLTSAVIDYLSLNTWYSIEVGAFFSESNTFERGCPLRVKTEKLLKVRLAGGERPNEGRVEVYYHGVWGAVCDEYWDMNDANVVCRSLGLPAASYAFSNTYMFGGEHKRSWMTRLQCSGTESSLADCRHAGWGNTYYWCSYHYYHAAVVCGQPPVTQKLMNASSGVIESPGYPRYMKQAHYKWTFRPTIPNVRVAVYLEKIDLRRYYGGMSKITIADSRNSSAFSAENQRRHAVGVLLTNVPVVISFYSSHTSRMGHGGNGIRMRYFVFSGSDDATTCSEKFKLMLQDTEYGRINISWTPLTMDPGTNDSAHPTYLVFYNSTAERVNNFTLVTNWTSAVIDYLSLNTWYSIEVVAFFSESNTFERGCPLRVKTEKLLKVRLAGGERPNEGRVEVYYHGVWGAVCDEYWDMNDANVVCRSLGLPAASYAFSNTYMFGGERRRSWMTRLQCSGTESSLADCRHAGWGNTYSWCFYHYYHAAVVCGQPAVSSMNIDNQVGTISSPGYPRKMSQAHLKWIFKSNAVIEFKDVYFSRYDGGKSYLTLTERSSQHLNYSQHQNTRGSKLFGKGLEEIEYYSSFTSNNGRGFRLRYLLLNESLDHVTLDRSWITSGRSTNYHSITVRWALYSAGDISVAGYLVACDAIEDQLGNVSYGIAYGNTSSGVCHNLVGYAYYNVTVYASAINLRANKTLLYRSMTTVVRTQEGVPTSRPVNVFVVWTKANSVLVQWEGIPRSQTHGVLLGYRIRLHNTYNYYDQKTITTNETEVIIKDLRSGTRYWMYINGFTAKGNGPYSYRSWTTSCGRNIENHMEGTIASPNNFRRWVTVDCTWTIKASSQKALILILFEVIDMPLSFGCGENFVRLTDGQGYSSNKICGRWQSLTFTSFGSAVVHYYAHERWAWRYNSVMNASFYIYDNGIANVPIISKWNISALSKNSTTIDVQWSDYPDKSKGVYKYMAICTLNTKLTAKTTNGEGRRAQLVNLVPYKNYTVQVLAFIGHSSNTTLARNTTIKRSQEVNITTLDDVPSKAPPNVSAETAAGSHSILVRWHHIPQKYIHGVLLGYRIYYQVAWSGNIFNSTFIESSKTFAFLRGLQLFTKYRVEVAGVTRFGEGPRSRGVFARTGCEQRLSGVFGAFTSPNYPNDYPSSTSCTWTIGKEMDFDELYIVFNSFDIEEGNGCSDEYVKVDKENGNLVLKKSCGRKNPFGIIATRGVVVSMLTDGGIEKKGFHAYYFLVDQNAKVIMIHKERVTETEVHLHWNASIVGINNFVVLYKESESNDLWSAMSTSNTRVTITNLTPRRNYQVRVVGGAGNGAYGSKVFSFTTAILFTTESPEETASPSPSPTEPVKFMYDYGQSHGDSVVPHRAQSYRRCLVLTLNDDGIPIFDKRYYELYVCINGLVRFGAPWYLYWPHSLGSSHHYLDEDLAMLAPYWSLVDRHSSFNRGISKVYYQVYDSSMNTLEARNVLTRATSDVNEFHPERLPTEFQASWVLVVTWDRLRHASINSETRHLYNTFQVVIMTNGMYTFSLFIYPPNGIQWSAPTSSSNYRRFWNSRGLPVIGISAGTRRYYNVPRSGTVNVESIDSIAGRKISYSRLRVQTSSHGVVGKWFFRLETSTGAARAEQKCRKWFKKQPDPRPFLEDLEPCPCTRRQAWWDERFTFEKNWQRKTISCAYSTFPSIDGWQQQCCYSGWGALIVGFPGGGTSHRYHRIKQSDHFESDVRSYDWCCVQSVLCYLYYEKRPSGDCSQYEPPEWSWMWGDPHFVSLDGRNYTFNGLGEYTMIDARDGFFQVQARTILAQGDGTATVLCAVVAKERNTSKVQLNLENEGNMTLLVDGEGYDYYSLTNQSTRLNGSVVISRPNDKAFRATFPSGISLTVTEVKGALSILLAMPKSFRNRTKGLLGTWNGDQSDDLTTPSGIVLPANASSKDIHFQFGQKWQVNVNSTLFTYKPGENVSTFSNTSFVPMFIEDLKFYNDSLKQQAYAACNDDINCLFDAASTKDVSVGISTKIIGSQMVNESSTLKNSPPLFQNGSSLNIYARVNRTERVTFHAKDPDGDEIKFIVLGLPDEKSITKSTNSSVTVVWNVTTQPVELEVIVEDSKGANSVVRPKLYICACHNGGDCLTSNHEEVDRNNSRFSIMSCQCASGYTGRFCENDIDACEVNMNPCYPGVQCKDLPAPANVTGFECGPCPSGFTGRGDSCSDIDECDGFTHGCSQICANTPGSFACDCKHGYLLNIDGRSCDDVNECDPASDCMQRCVNTPGSYRCTCDKYFAEDPANPKQCIAESPCKDGNHQCNQICYVSGGVDHCSCNTGYQLQSDNKTCSDIDECQTGKHRCNQMCRNTIGWYDCACVPGFRLDSDNVTCVDIDECMEWTFNCSTSMRCRNTIGSYKCQCEEGLYWIDNRCREPDKGEAPPPPPPPPEPGNPSNEDIQNSVNVTILDTNISEWNIIFDLKFKKAVAHEVTKGCAEDYKCLPGKRRSRRSNGYITFTSDQVHLLPGFPMQVYDTSAHNQMSAKVAFYIKFPPGVINGVTVNKNILIGIVNGSLAGIGKAINKILLSVEVYVVDEDASTTTRAPTTQPATTNVLQGFAALIGGSVAGAVVFVIVVVVVVVLVLRIRRKDPRREEEPQEVEMMPTSFMNHNYESMEYHQDSSHC